MPTAGAAEKTSLRAAIIAPASFPSINALGLHGMAKAFADMNMLTG
jgi:hypothetical protein